MKRNEIDLVQLSNGQQIFVFDIHELKSSQEAPELLATALRVLAHLFQNEGIAKVFHDCRKDSQALHQYLGICPKNVFDTAALYTLDAQLGLYAAQDALDVDEIHKGIEDPFQAGLNDVLKRYEATHGLNLLKQTMHNKFKSQNW